MVIWCSNCKQTRFHDLIPIEDKNFVTKEICWDGKRSVFTIELYLSCSGCAMKREVDVEVYGKELEAKITKKEEKLI